VLRVVGSRAELVVESDGGGFTARPLPIYPPPSRDGFEGMMRLRAGVSVGEFEQPARARSTSATVTFLMLVLR
jgi:hypothetical protein